MIQNNPKWRTCTLRTRRYANKWSPSFKLVVYRLLWEWCSRTTCYRMFEAGFCDVNLSIVNLVTENLKVWIRTCLHVHIWLLSVSEMIILLLPFVSNTYMRRTSDISSQALWPQNEWPPLKDRRLFDRGTLRQMRIVGQIAADRFIQTEPHLFTDIVHISEDIIVIMNLLKWLFCAKWIHVWIICFNSTSTFVF